MPVPPADFEVDAGLSRRTLNPKALAEGLEVYGFRFRVRVHRA